MSYYYDYYIGYKKYGKIYPLGPYDSNGEIHPAVSRSRSFASDLHNSFCNLPKEKMSDELKRVFEINEDDSFYGISYLNYKDLPSTAYIKNGYFLIEDVEEYNKTKNSEGLFYDKLDPCIYAEKARNELIFKQYYNSEEENEHNEEKHSCADYMFFSYPDYYCAEFEAFMIQETKCMLENYNINDYVVILWEG